jgi:hypothetical protein
MNDAFTSFLAFVFGVWAFCMWCYGIAVCWRADELFWAVVSFVMAPVGFLIGVYNWLF